MKLFFKGISKVYLKLVSSSTLFNINLSKNHWGILSYLKSTKGKLRNQKKKKNWLVLDKEHWTHSYSFVKLGEDTWLTGSWQCYKGAQGNYEFAGVPCWAWYFWSMKSWQHSHCRLHWWFWSGHICHPLKVQVNMFLSHISIWTSLCERGWRKWRAPEENKAVWSADITIL